MMLRLFPKFIHCNNVTRRLVSVWSPLAKTFNSELPVGNFTDNSSAKKSGLFGIDELELPSGFNELQSQAMTNSSQLIEEAISSHRRRKMVQIFDDLSDELCKVADLAEFIRVAHPNEQFAGAAENACLVISGIVENLNTHRGLYNALLNVVKSGDIQTTTDIDEHVSKLFLFDFEQCGIHLPEDLREKVVKINDNILQLGQKFMTGAVTPRAINNNILPKHIRKYFTNENGQILINSLCTDSSDGLVREAAYKIFLYPDSKQESLLKQLLNDRHELAQICDFPTYAHRAIKGSTVDSPKVVHDFLNILNVELENRAQKDFNMMKKMKKDETLSQNDDILPWDTAYFTSKTKKMILGASYDELAPYFSIGACMDGLNLLTQSLYGVRLESEPIVPGEVWAPNIHKIAVICENEGLLGHIYCDFYEREGKPNQDCHFTIRGGRLLQDGTYQNPIVVLMLSLPLPRWSNPCLLNPSSVDNLFHEMGHALHSMLGRTQYQHVTGTRCSADFAEVPSILMEYFSNDPRVVKLFAKHYQTQDPIPDKILEKLCASKNIYSASELQLQVFYSMLDQVYHSQKIETSTTHILTDIQKKYSGLPCIDNTAWQLRFSHLVGYGAKYYSYLISRAIASWIWQTYFNADPLSRAAGEMYRRECLVHGGGKPSSKVVSDFLHKQANAENFAASLIHEVDAKDNYIRPLIAMNN
ncbi:hypothetical protein PV327_006120 [Microctonus hyperodae]|uniref:Peptidase M3A/M3B catalytic domain-containing protein n=1 Tax=Microctonus hyperodae TaxID=165561 RepID=A0AA39G353_MICHY|nr:hypothetical protein PV327_006120 [Microctonus hyperodae]